MPSLPGHYSQADEVRARPSGINGILSNYQKKMIMERQQMVSAMTASVISTASTYPLDSIKTRMQAFNYSSIRTCVKFTYKQEGFGGFWRGALAPVLSIAFVRSSSFTVYDDIRRSLDPYWKRVTSVSAMETAYTPGRMPNFTTVSCFAAAGAISGFLITFISCPFELTKLRSQCGSVMHADPNKPMELQKIKPPKKGDNIGTIRCFIAVIKERGWRALYTGFVLHQYRDIIGSALYFGTYETILQLMRNQKTASTEEEFSTDMVSAGIAGGICGVLAWTLIYPIDSAKSRYQRRVFSKPPGTIVHPPKLEWFSRRMYSGLGISILRSGVVNCGFFMLFEYTRGSIDELELDEDEIVYD